MFKITCTRCNGMGTYEGLGTCFKCGGQKVIFVSEVKYQEYTKSSENFHKCEDTSKTWEQQVKERAEKKHAERIEKVEKINASIFVNERDIKEDFDLLSLLD